MNRLAAPARDFVLAAQAALLEAFPETVALIDPQGVIVAVNGSWRRFGAANSPDGRFPGVGCNYLQVYDRAGDPASAEAAQAAAGIRAVLEGRAGQFVLEYACHSPDRKNWFRLIVSPIQGASFEAALVMHVDITEPKLIAERLLESQALLLAASRVGRLGAWRLDYPGPIVTWSDDVRAIHEVAPDYQPTMETALDFYLPEDRPRVVASIRGCLGDGKPFDVKARVRTAKGREIWTRVIGEAVYGPDGAISQLQGGFQDITANEEGQAQVQRLEKRLAATLESMSDGFHFLDTDWNIAYLNDEAERLLRLRRADVIGRSLWEVFPATEGVIQDNYRQAMRTQQPVRFEIFFPPLDNWFEVHAFPTPEGLAVYFRPVTERKQAEELLARQAARLRASEQEYRLLFATNPQPMWVIDMETLRFLAVNTAAVAHYGYSEEEFLAMSVLDIRPTEDVPRFLDLLKQKNMPIQTGVHAHRRKDGTMIQVEVASDVVEFAGRRARVAMINDVTTRLQAEREARRAQRLESVGTLAGGVAHDLNNLLSPIALGIGLLQEAIDDPDNLGALRTMESNVRRASAVVRQLLAFARGSEGAWVPLQVEGIVAEVANIARNTFPKNIVLETHVAKDCWGIVADPNQIHQVLLNLCLNARDAMPGGGRLRILVSRAEIDEHYAHMHREMSPGRFALIEVSDTGTGIEPEIIERIFEPFFTTKALGKGSGLGLSSALGIIRAHGGFISPISRVGKGSTFKIYLPAAPCSEAEPPPPAPLLPRGNGELILLVDDELPILEITSKALRAFGYTVITAEDGARAVGLFAMRHQEIALVFTDIMMAGMDGVALIRTLKRMSPGVRVIAASGHNASHHAAAAVEAGAAAFLAKPYSAESMLGTIRAALTAAMP
jgi:two-component system, cell cycle sensor histidine kinase and response regulator CckA